MTGPAEKPYPPALRAQAERVLSALNAADTPLASRLIDDMHAESGQSAVESALIYHLIGLVALYIDETSRAADAFEQAHRLAPDIRDYAEALAALHARLGRVVDALFYSKMAMTATRYTGITGVLPHWLGSFEQHFYQIEDQPLLRRATKAAAQCDWPAAAKYYRQLTEIDPDDTAAWRGLAEAERQLGQGYAALDAMMELHRHAPDVIGDIAALGDTMALIGVWDQALDCHRHAASRMPADLTLGWKPVRTLLATPGLSRAVAATAMRDWGETASRHTKPLENRPAVAPLTAQRRLRIGAVGSLWTEGAPDLIIPLLNALPRHSTELHIYADGYARTPLARRLQTASRAWQEIGELDDETTAFILGNDELDVLIDLDGPLRRRRHGLFLRRPVGLMLSLADLPEAAGACGFNAVLGDDDLYTASESGLPVLRVAGVGASLPLDLSLLTERIERQPSTQITYGAVCGGRRITPAAVALWTRILQARPDAVLLLAADRLGSLRGVEAAQAAFEATGMADRVRFEPADTTTADYLGRLDALLDPPDNAEAETTLIHAAGGLPVVTRPGALPATRVLGGWLRRLGFAEWAASDDDAYVAAALRATDAAVRESWREAVRRECLEGVHRRALDLETALRQAIAQGGYV